MAAPASVMQTNLYQTMLDEGSKNPILAAAIAEMRLRQQKIKYEQDQLRENNAKLMESIKDKSGHELAMILRKDARADRKYFEEFSKTIKAYHTPSKIPFAVRYNKMREVIDYAAYLFGGYEDADDETAITKLIAGQVPNAYCNANNNFPILGDDGYWGTSKPTALSYALIAIKFSLNGHNIHSISLDSAIAHVAPLPADITFAPDCRFSYNTEKVHGFGYIHSGYSFGGYRDEEILYPNSKKFGPEDCSSFVAKITGCIDKTTAKYIEFSTLDQLYAYRQAVGVGFVSVEWRQSKTGLSMCELYQPITSIDAALPGDIMVTRTFNAHDDVNISIGTCGHTGIVLGKVNADTMAILAFGRNMPKLEGFGIQTIPFHTAEVKNNQGLNEVKLNIALRRKA